MNKIRLNILIITSVLVTSCNYLDIVPDNVATIDDAFSMKHSAEKYLFTCYSFLPDHASLTYNPAWSGGDEFWFAYPLTIGVSSPAWQIARGYQNTTSPYIDNWDGVFKPFVGIRDCNIFMENIEKVPDMSEVEKKRWIGEVKFIKAYHHFWLLRMYGPIPIIRENLPVDASVDEVRVYRDPIDDCIDYIVQLLDEAAPDLPDRIDMDLTELGRITKPIALAVKAKVLVTAASPMFNGNKDYTGFKDNRGVLLFNTDYDENKWIKAVNACREAVELCDSLGMELYTFKSVAGANISSEETLVQMSIRNSVCEKWNSEIIWANTNSNTRMLQSNATPYGLDPVNLNNNIVYGNLGVTLKVVEQFYSDKGVPITEDRTWDYNNRYQLREVSNDEKYHLQPGYTTVALNFNREPRYYASMAFDGGIWFGNGKLNDNDQWIIQSRAGQLQVKITTNKNNITGYWPKKLVHYENVITQTTHTTQNYAWPVMRLADLYLLYAEALNEAYGPSEEAYYWINLVRERAGLESVEKSWSQFSKYPDKYTTKNGFREIIHQERLNELSFEGQRFWDLRRWKRSHEELNKTITGWDVEQSEVDLYYREKIYFKQTFLLRDYLWPLKESNLLINPNLIQNPGW